MNAPRAGQPAQPSDLVDVAALVTAYYTRRARPGERRRAGRLRHLGAPRLEPEDVVQRDAHPGDHPGDLRVPARAGLRRAAVHRPRHPRPVRAGLGHGARGARRQRRHRARRLGRPLHPDARRVARHPHRQPRQDHRRRRDAGPHRSRRRHRGHPVAQPAQRRRVQVQPAARRPGRLRRHQGHRRPGQRADPRWAGRRQAGAVRAGPRRGIRLRLPRHLRRRPAQRARHRGDPRVRAADRRRPARRGVGRLLGRHRRAARARPHRRQPARRRHLAVHDARLGRQDPDGLLVARRRWPA